MNEIMDSKKSAERRTRIKKRQLALVLIAVLGLSLLVLVQRKLLNLGPGLSSNQGVITLVSINISVLTLAFLLYLILRGLYKVFFEGKDYGSLQTKMVVSFICLSLLPTILIFYFAYLLIGQDRETWFGRTLRNAIERSLVVAKDAVEMERELSLLSARSALEDFLESDNKSDDSFLSRLREDYGFASLEWYGQEGELLGSSFDPKISKPSSLPLDSLLEKTSEAKSPSSGEEGKLLGSEGRRISSNGLTRLVLPVRYVHGKWDNKRDNKEDNKRDHRGDSKWDNRSEIKDDSKGEIKDEIKDEIKGYLAFGTLEEDARIVSLEELETELTSYQAAIGIERPFQVTQLTSLAAVTLLAVFLSIWIGSNLAGSLAGPVTELVEGTRRVAQGDLDFTLQPIEESGEMAHLVEAFNLMTRDLKASYQELDQRRRFVETVLREVSSGVIVLDNDNSVININEAASRMLGLTNADSTENKTPPKPLINLIGLLKPDRGGTAGHIYLELPDGRTLSLAAHRTTLKSEYGESLGSLITFDDVSDLEKAQRLAAWREVAKRIAHEVKNPLTPISLAAQRLKRKFQEKIVDPSDSQVFSECVSVIIRQVESMRSLVSEFSEFARLPQLSPRPSDLKKVVSDTIALFREAHPKVNFTFNAQDDLGKFVFDPEQMGRVVTNLLTNATAALKENGRIDCSISYNRLLGVELTIKDNGPGLPREVREHLFEPYIKSQTGGQGLGLSIVKTIVNDHGGFVRVEDNLPKGTVITITLPYITASSA